MSTEYGESLLAVQKVDRMWKKISQPHEKLTEVDGRSPSYTECLRKMTKGLPAHGGLTEVNGGYTDGTESQWNFTEGLLVAQKVDGIWQKVTRQHGMLTEVDRRSLGHTNIWRKLTKGFWPHRNLTVVNRRPPGHTECWQKLTKGLPDAQEVDVNQLHIRLEDPPSIYCAARRPSVKFRQLFMWPVNLLSSSFKFPCSRDTFLELQSIFCAAWKPSVKLLQLSLRLGDLSSTSINFPCSQNPAVKISCWLRPSITFPCGQKTFRQCSVQPGVLP